MIVTLDDVGRICEKRDNPRRQFVIVAVDGPRVTLVERTTDHEFTITDTRTYDLAR